MIDCTTDIVSLCYPSQIRVCGISGNFPGILEIPILVCFLFNHLLRIATFAHRRRGDKPYCTIVINRRINRLDIFTSDSTKFRGSHDIARAKGIFHPDRIRVANQSANILLTQNRCKGIAIGNAIFMRTHQAAHKAAHIIYTRNGIPRCT